MSRTRPRPLPTIACRNFAVLAVLSWLVVSGGGAGSAVAQITNGDFESGPTGWSMPISSPGISVGIYDANCGDGIQAAFGAALDNDGGQACIVQDFDCGTEGSGGSCTITFASRFNRVVGGSDSARFLVLVDGGLALTVTPSDQWTSSSVDVPCGSHFLEICFEVDPADNAWTACIDDVAAVCDDAVSAGEAQWGALKARFR